MALGDDVWDVVETGYIKPIVLASKDDKLEFIFNAKGMNAILNGLAEAEFVKVMHIQTAKEMWDKRISSYEGNEKVKEAKLQTYRLKFEQRNIDEDETIRKYFLRVEDLVNAMKGLGQNIEESFLVQKTLRSLFDKFNPKVSAIEELNDLKTLSIDDIQGTLTAYEMRISKDKSITREASFKADKNTDSELDYIDKTFVRRLKKGFFYGYYFFCYNFGHKAITSSLICRYEQTSYSRNSYLPQQRLRQPSNKQPQTITYRMTWKRMKVKHNNSYEHNNRYDMFFSEPKCYNCHNYGHKDADCRLKNYKPDLNPAAKNFKVWKKKEDDQCGLVLSSQIQNNS
jgi:hypothetical protein